MPSCSAQGCPGKADLINLTSISQATQSRWPASIRYQVQSDVLTKVSGAIVARSLVEQSPGYVYIVSTPSPANKQLLMNVK